MDFSQGDSSAKAKVIDSNTLNLMFRPESPGEGRGPLIFSAIQSTKHCK